MTPSQTSAIKEELGLLAGHASMCWKPHPSTQEFDSTEATKAVDEAYNEIVRILATDDGKQQFISVIEPDIDKFIAALDSHRGAKINAVYPKGMVGWNADYTEKNAVSQNYGASLYYNEPATPDRGPLEIGVECGWAVGTNPNNDNNLV